MKKDMLKRVAALATAALMAELCACGSGQKTGSVGQMSGNSPSDGSPAFSSVPSSPVSVASPTPTPTPTPTPAPLTAEEVLAGKTALFFGDSIVAATEIDTEHPGWGWTGRIAEAYGLKRYFNFGVNGASISNVRGQNTVYEQVRKRRDYGFDFVVLEGGVNDAWDNAPVGKMSDMSPEEMDVTKLDLSTLAGGLEHLFYYVRQYCAGSTVVYVINFRLNAGYGSLRDMTAYVEMTKAICDKWDVPYLDLYTDDEFNERFNVKANTTDGIHPNSEGYKILTVEIAEFMADVYTQRHN